MRNASEPAQHVDGIIAKQVDRRPCRAHLSFVNQYHHFHCPLAQLRAEIDLLYRSLQAAFDAQDPNDVVFREVFIYRHARNISDLAEDCLLLAHSDRWAGAAILVRCITESLFSLAAAFDVPEFAAQKVVAETDYEVRKLAEWEVGTDAKEQKSWSAMLGDLKAFKRLLRQKYGAKGDNQWTVIDTAKAAKLEEEYAQTYFLYSRHVHATFYGVALQEKVMTVGHILQMVSLTTVRAISYLLRTIEVNGAQRLIDEATTLLDRGLEMIESGVYKEFSLARLRKS